MRIRLLITGVLAASLLLTGCGGGALGGPTDKATPEPSPSETAEPVATVLLISLDGVAVVNDDESVAAEAPFSDGVAVLELLVDLAGSTPEAQVNSEGYPITFYDWGPLSLTVVTDAGATLSVGDDEFAGLAVHTADGIHAGSSRADAAAVASYDGKDFDGDGQPDYLGLEAAANPAVESLELPGQPGTDFIMLVIQGDVVTRLITPSSDYGDL
jgi:hypothetical protein